MSFIKISALLCLLVLPSIALSQAPAATSGSEYVNYKYDGVVPDTTLSNGVRHLGGGMLGDIESDPAYGISHVSKSRTHMLWLEVSTGRDGTGITGWQVKDVLVFPSLTVNDHLFFAMDPSIECTRNGKEISNLVAVGQIFTRKGIYKPAKAWIANLEATKFEAIPVSELKCQYSEP